VTGSRALVPRPQQEDATTKGAGRRGKRESVFVCERGSIFLYATKKFYSPHVISFLLCLF